MIHFLIGLVFGAILCVFCVVYVWRKKHKVDDVQAGVIYRSATPTRIVFSDTVVMPFFERMEYLSLCTHKTRHSFLEEESLYAKNWQKLDVQVLVQSTIPKDRARIQGLLTTYGREKIEEESFFQDQVQSVLSQALPSIFQSQDAQDWILRDRSETAQNIFLKIKSLDVSIDIESVQIVFLRSTDIKFYNVENLEDKRGWLSFYKDTSELEDIEAAWKNIQMEKKQIEEERKELHVRQFELQSQRLEVEGEERKIEDYIASLRKQLHVQIDLLKTHLDVELNNYKRDAAQQAALLGKTTPASVERESEKLRNRFRIDADSWSRERDAKIATLEKNIKKEEE